MTHQILPPGEPFIVTAIPAGYRLATSIEAALYFVILRIQGLLSALSFEYAVTASVFETSEGRKRLVIGGKNDRLLVLANGLDVIRDKVTCVPLVSTSIGG